MTGRSWQAWMLIAGLAAGQRCRHTKRLSAVELTALNSLSVQQRMKFPSTSASAEEFLVWSWLLRRALFVFGPKHAWNLLLALCIMESRPFDQTFTALKYKYVLLLCFTSALWQGPTVLCYFYCLSGFQKLRRMVWREVLPQVLNDTDLLWVGLATAYRSNWIFTAVSENFCNFEGVWFISGTNLTRCNWDTRKQSICNTFDRMNL